MQGYSIPCCAAGNTTTAKTTMAYGVIGNTTVSGTVILGSSPGRPAAKKFAAASPVRLAA